MAERPIDELKIKISVDESGSVSKSLADIIAKLEKIEKVGGGKADQFTDLLTTLSNMDSSLSKISASLTSVSSGISKIAKATEGWGGKFSSDLKNIDKGMANVAAGADKAAKSAKDLMASANTGAEAPMARQLSQVEEYQMRIRGLQKDLAKAQSVDRASWDEKKISSINKSLRLAQDEYAKFIQKQEEARTKAAEAYATITEMVGKTSNAILMLTDGSERNAREAFGAIQELLSQTNNQVLMLTDGSERLKETFSTIKITSFFDDASISNVSEDIDNIDRALQGTTETTQRLGANLEDVTEVNMGKVLAEFDANSKAVENLYNQMTKVVTEEERLNAIDFSKQFTKVDILKEKYNELAEKLALMLKQDNFGGKAFANVISEMQKIQAQIDKILQSEQAIGNTGSFQRIGNAAGNAAKKFLTAHINLKKIQKTLSGAGSLLLSNPFSGMASSIANVSKKLKGLGKSFLRTARMRMFRYMIRSITAGLKEGVDNAYEWSRLMDGRMPTFAESMDKVATATQYLKNSLGALVTPIINAVAPAFDFLIDKVVAFINVINQLIARLTGATMWTRAVKNAKQYKDSLDSAASSAGKLAEELITILGIDEINPMASDKGSGGAGGSGASDGADYGAMFVNEALGEMSGRMSEMFEPFKRAWESKGQTVITSIKNTFTNLQKLVGAVGDSFWAVWTNGTGQKTVETILGIFTGISDTIGNIAKQLKKGWETDNLGTQIIQNLWNTLNSLLGMWERITTSTAEWAETLDFTPLLSGIENFTNKFSKFYDKVADFGANVWEKAILPFAKWIVEDIAPVALDAIAEAIGVVTEAWKLVEPGLKWLWDNILSPSLGTVGTAVKDALELIRDILKTIKGYLQDINDLINGNKTLKEFLEQGAKNTPGETTPERVSQKEDWQSVGTTTGTTADSLGQYIYDKYDNNPVQIKAEVLGEKYTQKFEDPTTDTTASATIFEDKTPKGSRIIADVLARANALDSIGMPAGKKVITGVTGGISGLKDGMTSDKRYMPGLLGGVSALKSQLNSKTGVLGNIIAEATKLNKGKGFSIVDAIRYFTTYSTGLNKDRSRFTIADGIRYFTTYSTALYKDKTRFSIADGIRYFAAYATLLGKGRGFTIADAVRYITVYASSLKKQPGKTLSLTGRVSAGQGKAISMAFARGGIIGKGFWKNLPQYSSGTLNAGTIFAAGEAGPEIVGHVNGKTEVLNQSQIAQAMAQSMEAATAGQNRLLQEQNTLLRELIQKQGTSRNYVTSGDVIDGLQQRNRRDGRTVVAIGV